MNFDNFQTISVNKIDSFGSRERSKVIWTRRRQSEPPNRRNLCQFLYLSRAVCVALPLSRHLPSLTHSTQKEETSFSLIIHSFSQEKKLFRNYLTESPLSQAKWPELSQGLRSALCRNDPHTCSPPYTPHRPDLPTKVTIINNMYFLMCKNR
jgi:hypothetical protein